MMKANQKNKPDDSDMSFWAHLDAMRGMLLRCVVAWGVASVGAFFLKDLLFSLLFAPSHADFITWRLLGKLGITPPDFPNTITPFSALFISTELTGQFMTHMQVSLWAGLVVALPYIIWQIYLFIQPAIGHIGHRKWFICIAALSLFFAGVLLNYWIIFPFALRFLITYQVQASVVNMITLSSYIGTFTTLSLIMGILFELPLLAWALAHIGVLEAIVLRKYRKHSIVLILILAAIITPTGDAFTLLLVSIPIYLLYELSIGIVARVNRHLA